MPFCTGERVWKIRLYGTDGLSRGLIELAGYERDEDGSEHFVRYLNRSWPGQPRAQHFETLYEWEDDTDPL